MLRGPATATFRRAPPLAAAQWARPALQPAMRRVRGRARERRADPLALHLEVVEGRLADVVLLPPEGHLLARQRAPVAITQRQQRVAVVARACKSCGKQNTHCQDICTQRC